MNRAVSGESPSTLIVGLGSPHGDDQLGWLVVERLEQDLRAASADGAVSSDLKLRRAATPSDLLDWLPGPARLILIDACEGPAEAFASHGWRRLEASDTGKVATRTSLGHLVGLPAVLALARLLNSLPPHVELWAIHGECFAAGTRCHPKAEARATEFARRLANLLRSTEF